MMTLSRGPGEVSPVVRPQPPRPQVLAFAETRDLRQLLAVLPALRAEIVRWRRRKGVA